MKKHQKLNDKQKHDIKVFLNGPPVSLSHEFKAEDFHRELDVFVYDADIKDTWSLYTLDNNFIKLGKFFRIVEFSNIIFAALYCDHDKYGVFGQPKYTDKVNFEEIEITSNEYTEFLKDLSQIVISIESDMQIEFNKVKFLTTGPTPK